MATDIFSWEELTVISSAYIYNLIWSFTGISANIRLNKVGERVDPWGVPALEVKGLEIEFLYFTLFSLLVEKLYYS